MASFSSKFHASFEDYKGSFLREYTDKYELINDPTIPLGVCNRPVTHQPPWHSLT